MLHPLDFTYFRHINVAYSSADFTVFNEKPSLAHSSDYVTWKNLPPGSSPLAETSHEISVPKNLFGLAPLV